MSRNGPGQVGLRRAHSALLETGSLDPTVRSVVGASWQRSIAAGVSSEYAAAPLVMSTSQLAEYRAAHRLSHVFPLLHDILGRIAEDCDCVMALGDEFGQLLWLCGQSAILRRAESINFIEGTSWEETRAGTNAPGTALRLDAPVVIGPGEHFNRQMQRWSCAAAPIHDPATQAIVGILDVTGSADVASPQTLGMVRAAARMAEIELARIAAVEAARPAGLLHRAGLVHPSGRTRPGEHRAVGVLRVQALGRSDCTVDFGDHTVRLSPRHGEILALLMDQPDGMTGEQLEILLYAGDVHRSTLRAEMTRLRGLLGEGALQSRPYRLTTGTVGDWQIVADHLRAGRMDEAVTAYRGPLLPQSDAPGIVDLRDNLHRQIRAALLDSSSAELLAAWTRTRWGASDLPMWQRQAAILPIESPLRGLALSEIRRVEDSLGVRHR